MKWQVRMRETDKPDTYECDATVFQYAAAEIAEQMDCDSAHYPDERSFEMWCPLKNGWRKVTVEAENTREYSAFAEPYEKECADDPDT